jgi:flagellar protein FliS
MFTMMLEASHSNSAEQFYEVIACIRNVRDAWAIVAKDPAAGRVLPRELRTRQELALPAAAALPSADSALVSRWSA